MSNIAMDGVVVLDLSRVVSGPYATMLFADMGARVIKVELPGVGDDTRLFGPLIQGQSPYYMTINRNKESITLNMKSPEGKRLLWELVKQADIVVENFRPGVLDRLGFGYAALKKVNPRLVLGSLSGFGQTGPYAQRAGYDVLAQAMSGMMSINGWPGGKPTKMNTAIGDVLGGLSLAAGVLAAYSNAIKTGVGQWVDVSLADSAISALCTINHIFLATGQVPGFSGGHDGVLAPFGAFACKGGSVIVAAGNDKLFGQLCALMERPELVQDERFCVNEARMAHREELQAEIESWLSSMDMEQAVETLLNAGIAAGPINTIDKVAADPHMGGAREMFPTIVDPVLGPIRITGSQLKMSDTPTGVRKNPPALGEDNAAVYGGLLGLSEEEIRSLRDNHVI